MKVEMMMLMRLKDLPAKAIAPSTMSQLTRMGMKPSNVSLRRKRKLTSSTAATKSIDTHCRMLNSRFMVCSVSVV